MKNRKRKKKKEACRLQENETHAVKSRLHHFSNTHSEQQPHVYATVSQTVLAVRPAAAVRTTRGALKNVSSWRVRGRNKELGQETAFL